MAKKVEERSKARRLFVEFGMSQKEISNILSVSEKTISKWANEDNWKAAQTAHLTSNDTVLENGKTAIANLSDILLDLQKERKQWKEVGNKEEVASIDSRIMSISDAIAKTTASINKFEKTNAISFVSYLNVMQSIFKSLLNENPKLHSLTLDFQESHIQEMAKKLA